MDDRELLDCLVTSTLLVFGGYSGYIILRIIAWFGLLLLRKEFSTLLLALVVLISSVVMVWLTVTC